MPGKPWFPLFPLFLLLLLPLPPDVRGYEAKEDKQDLFARKACPAFLTFVNAAYLEGVTVELPCHCKPQQVQSVVWFFRKHLAGSEETRALTDHHGNKLLDSSQIPHSGDLRSRFFIRLFSLLIFRAGTEDSGIYICGSAKKDFFYAYDLDIQKSHALTFTTPSLSPESNSAVTDRGRGSAQYRLFTGWRPWSVCDRCGPPGEQVRVGLCYVHSHLLHVRYRRTNQTVASCGSGAVPRAFSHLTRDGAAARLEVKSCQVACPASPPSKLLAVMSFFGYRSPSMPGEVPVYYLNHPADRILTLGCPNARPNMAVAWDRESEPIYRFKHLARQNLSSTSPRLTIDTGHHLVFTPAKIQDSGVYYCWLQGRKAAEIRLLVYLHFGRGLSITSHPEFTAAVSTVLKSYAAMTGVFCLFVFSRAAIRHLRDTRETHLD